MKPSFSIVGCGRVGTALAKFLAEAGYTPAGFASKSLSSAKRTALLIGSTNFTDVLWEATKADIVFITTPDGAIEEVCSSIANNKGFSRESIVLHCSGALTSNVLLSAKVCGASIGSMHPLQSFASTGEYGINPFSGIVTSVEGDKKAVDAASIIVKDLGSVCISIKTDAKILYHASAVVASNYLVTLLDLSLNLIGQAGVPAKEAFMGLKPLIQGTLSNIEKMGIDDALTGPIARGDIQTIENHLSEIGSKTPNLLPLYKILGLHTIEIAKAKKTLTDSAAKRLKELFGD
ncbi:Rossmann-like and DUF2520 domain-containing protein [Desulfobacterium sp. N47]|uniref:DUF2520 domain-containing protein n=1 Tax=uncultured Desulfobacterium sp. TaxID=201089 RepID=E1YLS0_9BACT|nr:hypothetical protein N47_E45650 [uncultured Desulfobacterium sp.]